jgi:hypothetical protein
MALELANAEKDLLDAKASGKADKVKAAKEKVREVRVRYRTDREAAEGAVAPKPVKGKVA